MTKKIPAPPKKATASPSTIGEPPPSEPLSPLEISSAALTARLRASGLTVVDVEPESDTTPLRVTFVPKRTT